MTARVMANRIWRWQLKAMHRLVMLSNNAKRLHATILHQKMDVDPNRLSYFYSGLNQKPVGVEPVEPIGEII